MDAAFRSSTSGPIAYLKAKTPDGPAPRVVRLLFPREETESGLLN